MLVVLKPRSLFRFILPSMDRNKISNICLPLLYTSYTPSDNNFPASYVVIDFRPKYSLEIFKVPIKIIHIFIQHIIKRQTKLCNVECAS